MGRQTKELCRAIAASVKRGEITRQQDKTLMGQAKCGDIHGAKVGLSRMSARVTREA